MDAIPSGCIVVQKQSVGLPVIDYDYEEIDNNQTENSPTLVVSARRKFPQIKENKVVSIKPKNGKLLIRIGKTNKFI